MKLSDLNVINTLHQERMDLGDVLSAINLVVNDNESVTFGANGYELDIPVGVATAMIECGRAYAMSRVAEIEADMAQLGFEVDDPLLGDDADDELGAAA